MLQTKNNKINRLNNNINKNNTNNNLCTKEFEINDVVRTTVRNILTKGQTHDEISQYSGASISTRGRYISPSEKTRGFIHDRPLYLFIQGNSKNDIDLAIQKIEEIIQRESTSPKFTKFPTRMSVEKIMVGLDHAPPEFDLKGRVLGVDGANLNYIRNETGAIATLRGKGSSIDHQRGYESAEPMHLYLEHARFNGLQAAKQLAKNLIETLQQELVHFQQMNPPITNIQMTTQPNVVPVEIFQQQPPTQINLSQQILAVPPPVLQPQAYLQQQNNIQVTQQQPQQQQHSQTILPQSTLISHQMPIQLHHGGNMVIQQQEQPSQAIGNLNIPPPGLHMPMKAGQLLQLQGPTSHLSHPPPNIQLQAQQHQPTQILLNQAPPNYQYQYVQQAQSHNPNEQQAQVTIQHIYQTPQQIHGIVQQTSQLPPQFDQMQVRGQQIQTTQQYITLPGNTFMMPPPNIIQHQQHQQQQQRQNQNVIYSSQPHHIHYSMANDVINQNTITTTNTQEYLQNIKEEKKIENNSNSVKLEIKSEGNKKNGPKTQASPAAAQQTPIMPPVSSSMTIPYTQMPPPIPPPNIQQIVENSMINSTQQQHNQNQILQNPTLHPHQIQIAPNTAGNSNFILNTQQWQTQPNNHNQILHNIHVGPHTIRNAPEGNQSFIMPGFSGGGGGTVENFQHFQHQPNHRDGNNVFNAQNPNQGMGIQIQFQTGPPPIVQQLTGGNQGANIEQQQQFNLNSLSSPRFNLPQSYIVDINQKMNQQQKVMYQMEPNTPQHLIMQQQQQQPFDSYKNNRKRKSENDVEAPSNSVAKIGMGSIINERETQRMVITDHLPPPISSNINSTTTTTTTRSTPHNITDEQHKERIEFNTELRAGTVFPPALNPPLIDGRPNQKCINSMIGNRNNLPYSGIVPSVADDGARRFNLDTLPPPLPPSFTNRDPRFKRQW